MNMNQQQGRPGGELQVVRRDPANGKELFRTGETEELKQYQLLGTPLPAGGMLYLPACKTNQPSELHVLAVQSAHRPRAMVDACRHLSVQSAATRRPRDQADACCCRAPGSMSTPRPADWWNWPPTTGAIRWAYNYPAKMPVQQQHGVVLGLGRREDRNRSFGPSGPLVAGGQLFIKGMQSPRLFALRPDGSALDWKRAVPENAMLAGIDDEPGLSGRRRAAGLRPENAATAVGQQPAGQIGLDRAAGDRAPLLSVHAARNLRVG